MGKAPSPSTDTVVLTAEGRRRLEDRLLQATESLRAMAERLGERDDVPTDEYRRTLAQVEELRGVLDRARPPTEVPDDPSIIEVGDEVVIEYEDGDTERRIVVDPVEAALGDDRVSVASPLGQALVGRRVGDEVTVEAPAGEYRCVIRGRRRAA